jgi:hypothetical protein
VQNILKIVSLDRFLGVKKFQELLNELRSNVNFK